MTGRASRQKGAGAEREIVEILKAHGYDVHRTPHSGALEWLKGDICGLDDFHIEVKRQEKTCIDAWCEQAESQAEGKTALLFYRRSRQPWRVVLRLDDFLRLLER